MNKAQMSQRMNNIARNAGKMVQKVAQKATDPIMKPIERRMEAGRMAREDRNTQMINDNYPGGMAAYEVAANKRAADKVKTVALGVKVKKNIADKGLVARTKNIDGIYKIK